MRRTKELIENDYFCFGIELTYNYVQQTERTTPSMSNNCEFFLPRPGAATVSVLIYSC